MEMEIDMQMEEDYEEEEDRVCPGYRPIYDDSDSERRFGPPGLCAYEYSVQADDDTWLHMGILPDVGQKRKRMSYDTVEIADFGPARKLTPLDGRCMGNFVDDSGYYKDEVDLETGENLDQCLATERALFDKAKDPSTITTYYTTDQWRKEARRPILTKKAFRRYNSTPNPTSSNETGNGSNSFSSFTGFGFSLSRTPLGSTGLGFGINQLPSNSNAVDNYGKGGPNSGSGAAASANANYGL